MNDSLEKDEYGSIGNLFPCTKKLNNSFGNKNYDYKRSKYIDCQYKWINDFGNKYKKFNLESIKKRTKELENELIDIIRPDFEALNKFMTNYKNK